MQDPTPRQEASLIVPERVSAGTQISVRFSSGVGAQAVRYATVDFAIPDGMTYAEGSARVNGRPAANGLVSYNPSRRHCVVNVGNVKADERCEVELACYIQAPCDDGTKLEIVAAFSTELAKRTLSASTHVEASPEFAAERNGIEFDDDTVSAGRRIRATLTVVNDGTMMARNAIARLEATNGLVATFAESGDRSLDVGDLEPGSAATICVWVTADAGSEGRCDLSARLEYDGPAGRGRFDVPTAQIQATRPPMVGVDSGLFLRGGLAIRAGEPFAVEIVLHNTGGDSARSVEVSFDLEDGLSVVGGRKVVSFGDLHPGSRQTHGVMLAFGDVEGRRRISAVVRGEGLGEVALEPVYAEVASEVSFTQHGAFRSRGIVTAYEPFAIEMQVVNDGNSTAATAEIEFVFPPEAHYEPGTLLINGFQVADEAFVGKPVIPLRNVRRGAVVAVELVLHADRPTQRDGHASVGASVRWSPSGEFSLQSEDFAITPQPKYPDRSDELPFEIPGLAMVRAVSGGSEVRATQIALPASAMASSAGDDVIEGSARIASPPTGTRAQQPPEPPAASVSPVAEEARVSAPAVDNVVESLPGTLSAEPEVVPQATAAEPAPAGQDEPEQQVTTESLHALDVPVVPVLDEPEHAALGRQEDLFSEPAAVPVNGHAATTLVEVPSPGEQVREAPAAFVGKSGANPAAKKGGEGAVAAQPLLSLAVPESATKRVFGTIKQLFGDGTGDSRLAAHVALLIALLPEKPDNDVADSYSAALGALREVRDEIVFAYQPGDGMTGASIDIARATETCLPFVTAVVDDPAHNAILDSFPSLVNGDPSFFGSLAAVADTAIQKFDLTVVGVGVALYVEEFVARFCASLDDASPEDVMGYLDEEDKTHTLSPLDECVVLLREALLDEVERAA